MFMSVYFLADIGGVVIEISLYKKPVQKYFGFPLNYIKSISSVNSRNSSKQTEISDTVKSFSTLDHQRNLLYCVSKTLFYSDLFTLSHVLGDQILNFLIKYFCVFMRYKFFSYFPGFSR